MEYAGDCIKERTGDFALKVSGNDLYPLLVSGDLVYAREGSEFMNGQLILVQTEEGTLCRKGYRKDDGSIRLVPPNPDYAKGIADSSQVFAVVTGYTHFLREDEVPYC